MAIFNPLNLKPKKIAAAILLLGIAVFFYWLYAYFFYTCCALPPKLAPISSNGINDNPVLNDPNLLYAKRALIGLCRTKSGRGGSCHFNTYLYSSGKLIIESGEVVMAPDGEKRTIFPAVERQLDGTTIDRIIKQVRDSGIINKSCDAESVMDVYVDYFINLDGVKKQVQFPGCESEFKAIDKLIDAAADQ